VNNNSEKWDQKSNLSWSERNAASQSAHWKINKAKIVEQQEWEVSICIHIANNNSEKLDQKSNLSLSEKNMASQYIES
jgi:protein-arginine kinase activator protein McsA